MPQRVGPPQRIGQGVPVSTHPAALLVAALLVCRLPAQNTPSVPPGTLCRFFKRGGRSRLVALGGRTRLPAQLARSKGVAEQTPLCVKRLSARVFLQEHIFISACGFDLLESESRLEIAFCTTFTDAHSSSSLLLKSEAHYAAR